MTVLDCFREIWAIDFEFGGGDGERPDLRCLVAREYRSGKLIRAWVDKLAEMPVPPFPIIVTL